MHIVCSDLEGVLVPEIWINIAQKTGIKELELTTRDISDYDILMKKRLSIINKNGLKIDDIKKIICSMEPFEGAVKFLNWLRSCVPVIIVSDTFIQFAKPLIKKLGWPTLFCNSLQIHSDGSINEYKLRKKDGKRQAIILLRNLNYKTIAVGDSYNDITMLKEADTGILFQPPDNIKNDFTEFVTSYSYKELKSIIQSTI